MNLEHLQSQVSRDVRIDEQNLDTSAVNVPILYSKYLQLHSQCVLSCVKLQADYDKLYSKKYMFYRNDYSVILKNKAEIDVLIAGDEEIQNIRLRLDYEKTCANYLESVCKQIAGLSFLIKDAVEFKKFMNGM